MRVGQEALLFSSLGLVSRESTENIELRSFKLVRKLTKEETMSQCNCSSTSESNSLWCDIKVTFPESPLCICSINASATTRACNVGMQGHRGCCTWPLSHCTPFTLEPSTWASPAACCGYRVTSSAFSPVGSHVECSINLISLWMRLFHLTVLYGVNKAKSTVTRSSPEIQNIPSKQAHNLYKYTHNQGASTCHILLAGLYLATSAQV